MHCKSLWIKASAKCINVNVKCLDSPKSEESLNLLQDGASLDPGQTGESLDGDIESLDPAESMEFLNPID